VASPFRAPSADAPIADPREAFTPSGAQPTMAPAVVSPHQPVLPVSLGDALSALVAPHRPETLLKASIKKREPEADLGYVVSGQQANDLDPHVSHPGKTALLVTLTVASVLVGCVYNPQAAHADAARPTTSATNESDLAKLARSYGLDPTVLEKAVDNGEIAGALKILPTEMRQMYRELSGQHKKMIVEKLQGTSGFLFVRVSNRDAFIKGEAMGVNTFDEMEKMLGEKAEEMKLDGALKNKLFRSIQEFRKMTPQQRSALVTLMELDVGAVPR